jgi:hypothetical protein
VGGMKKKTTDKRWLSVVMHSGSDTQQFFKGHIAHCGTVLGVFKKKAVLHGVLLQIFRPNAL